LPSHKREDTVTGCAIADGQRDT